MKRTLTDTAQVHWFYTPMALRFARDLPCDLCVVDQDSILMTLRDSFCPPSAGLAGGG